MKHTVLFDNQDNHWDNGLPLGNGVFGTMVYYEKQKLFMPMNHYEVYYNISSTVLPEDKLAATPTGLDGKAAHAKIRALAEACQPPAGEPYCDYTYRKDRREAMDDTRLGLAGFSNSYPCTGDLEFRFSKALDGCGHSLLLDVESAVVTLELKKAGSKLRAQTIVADADCLVTRFTQSDPGLLTSVRVSFPQYRDYVYPDIEFSAVSESCFAYSVTRTFAGSDAPFVFSGILQLIGAEGTLQTDDTGATILLTNAKEEVTLLTGIFTDWRYKDTKAEGIRITADWADSLDNLYASHKKRWDEFFSRSSISLPDKFLEHIYYINQYALGCCSGKDGIMKHHACGLNGLWAVKHPNLWGSMWYWDVNIQAAFAGVFSSNRLDLGGVFSDGLLSYRELMERYAQNQHGMSGYAADYPYYFYYCVVPWCAQYLWYQYEYSLDKAYLEKEAYPFFLKLSEFVTQIFEYDPADDTYHVYPDISPEQGPLAHDTTITVACCKYLLRITLEAARILDDHSPLLEQCRAILDKMPGYAVAEGGYCTPRLKDSPDAPANMFIRHPSMLMPLFPIGELGLHSDEQTVKTLRNTLDYLEDNCEIGIFGGSWLAAAAARLGRGQMALRLLYEHGIDHMLRSNGLTAEETERFMNYCLILRQPLYYPCMMEFTGEMLAAVNEMLLQSVNGLIRVFPALPDGDPEFDRMIRKGCSYHDYPDRYISYPAWRDVRFDRLLAKGAFEISASVKDGELQWITVLSKKGGAVNITCPLLSRDMQVWTENGAHVYDSSGNIISFDTLPGALYWISMTQCIDISADGDADPPKVMRRQTATRRHIYIGEDPEAQYQKALDGFIRDWYLGNMRLSNHTVYKFDFGTDAQKPYHEIFRRQSYAAEKRLILNMAPVFVKDLQFAPKQGYGFRDASFLEVLDRGTSDGLRRDFVHADRDAEFCIEVPRGQYELFAVSGDEAEASVTILDCEHGRAAGGEVIPAGQYQCKVLPLVLEEDGLIRLKLTTKPGYRWKLNYLFLNCVKGY